MAALDYSNNAKTTLSASIVAGDTSIAVADGSGFPTSNFYVTFTQATGTTETSWEIVLVSSRSGNTLTVTRGQDGTSAASWASGSKVSLRVVNALLDQFPQAGSGSGVPLSDGSTWTQTATTGTGNVVRATSPTLTTPNLGTPSTLVGTNITGTAASLTAGAATVLATARTINGTSFDGSANITVTAAAGTLTGTVLNATVVTSSLTSVGTIATGVWQGTIVGVTYGGTGANLSATGGTNQVLKQSSAGAAVTVGTLASTNLSDTAKIMLIDTTSSITAAKTFAISTFILGNPSDPAASALVFTTGDAFATPRTITYVDPGGAATLPLVTTTSTTTTHVAHATAVAGVMAFSALAVADLPALNGFTDNDAVAHADVVPYYDTSAAANRDATMEYVKRLIGPTFFFVEDECFDSTAFSGMRAITSGSGAANSTIQTAVAGHPGILNCSTGTTTTGLAGLYSSAGGGAAANLILGSGLVLFDVIVRLTTLSDGTETFSWRLGINDSGTFADGADSVMFRYTHSVNAGEFEAVTRANSVETATDTNVAVAAGTWYRLRAVVNTAASSVTFQIGVAGAALSTVATHTTNIPSGAGRESGFAYGILKSAGTTARTFDIDCYSHGGEVSR